MNRLSWQLRDTQAQFRFDDFTASVDLKRPDRGLSGIFFSGQPLQDQQVLGVDLPTHELQESGDLESYERGVDLVANYRSDKWPVRTQLYWRAWECTCAGPVVAVELLASVQTHLLDSHPARFTHSRMPSSNVRAPVRQRVR